MNKYEGIFIMKPTLNEENLKALVDMVENEIKKNKGKVDKVESWGGKKLAYPIKKFNEGVYYRMEFDVEPAAIKDMDRKFRLNDNILRFMIIKKERGA